jgi:hypothetical protein
MNPLLRACTHVVNINLGRASDLIRAKIKGLYQNLEDIIVDVSVPPIPKYSAQVEYEGQDGPEYTYLSSASHVARGILGDAISNMAVYLYGSGKPQRIEKNELSQSTEEDEVSFSISELKGLKRDLAEAIIEASGHIRKELVRPDNKGRKKVIRCANLKELYPEIWSEVFSLQDNARSELLEISSRFQDFANPDNIVKHGDFLLWLETDMIPRFKELDACLLIFEPWK